MTSSAEQFLQLKNEIAGLRSRVTGLSASGQLYAATGQRIVYGCKVTQGSSATDMTIALESSASGDTAHLNPDLSLTPTYQFEYPNIAGLKSGGFYSLDLTAEVDAVPATGLGRYDIAYIYVGPTGPGFAVATGTPGAGVKTAFDADGLDTSAYDPDTDAAIPVGAFAVARIYVEDDASGIANARIADLRLFSQMAGFLSINNNGVAYINASGLLTTSTAFTYDGDTLTVDDVETETLTLSGGTANGVAYLNGSKVLTTGSGLQFDGATLRALSLSVTPTGDANGIITIQSAGSAVTRILQFNDSAGANAGQINNLNASFYYDAITGGNHVFRINGTAVGEFNASGLALSGGTANGVAFLNAGKVLTTGSGLAFATNTLTIQSITNYKNGAGTLGGIVQASGDDFFVQTNIAGGALRFYTGGGETARINSNGNLGLGTSTITDPYGGSNHRLLTMSGTWGGVINFALGSTTYASVGNRPSGNTGLRLAAYGSSVYDLVEVVTNGSVRATFDVSGNLGLGVTPSAWASSFRALQIGTRTNLSQSTNSTYLGNNAYYNGANWIYQISAAAAQFSVQEDGSFLWQSTGSGTAGNPITFTQAMRLDVAGALSITGSGGTGTHPLKLTSTGCDLLRFEMNTAGSGSYIQSTNAAESAYEPLGFYAESYAFNVGKMGIGGAALTDQLNVLGAARFGDGTNYAGISADATGTLIESAAGAHTVRINTAGAQAVTWDASGNLIQKLNASAPTLTVNSTMTFELTSNTSLAVKVRGSDGTTRSVALTLA